MPFLLKRLRPSAALVCALLFPAQWMLAWNATGHRAMAFLAYSHLTEKAKLRIDLILRMHPDYGSILSKGASSDPVDVARNAFVTAATWPDLIRNDPRFFDKPGSGITPLPGFPDMARHQSWHFINTPVPAEFSSVPIDPENAMSQYKALLARLRKNDPVTPEQAFALPWVIHLETDLHEPLHAVDRFRLVNGKPADDRGGNTCNVTVDRNLHSLWDNILGTNPEEGAVARLAGSLADHQPLPKKLDLKPEAWIREAAAVSGSVVYGFTGDCSDRNHPLELPADYRPKARLAAMQRAALGAYRLAGVLNDRLGK